MKKCALLLLAACLLFPMKALAAGDQMGVYVAPKFIYGIETFKMKGKSSEGDSVSMGSGTDTVFGGALAVGYDFNKKFDMPVRVELEYAAFSQGEDSKSFYDSTLGANKLKGKIDVQSLFANVYYDFRNSTQFTPYVGAGIGLGFVGMKASVKDLEDGYSANMGKKTRTNFAWNVGLGCAYDFTDYFALDLGYRYADFGKAKTKSATNDDLDVSLQGKSDHVAMHQFVLAARFTF